MKPYLPQRGDYYTTIHRLHPKRGKSLVPATSPYSRLHMKKRKHTRSRLIHDYNAVVRVLETKTIEHVDVDGTARSTVITYTPTKPAAPLTAALNWIKFRKTYRLLRKA